LGGETHAQGNECRGRHKHAQALHGDSNATVRAAACGGIGGGKSTAIVSAAACGGIGGGKSLLRAVIAKAVQLSVQHITNAISLNFIVDLLRLSAW
jgi:hypothetical protein